jgi:type II secretory pathway pseudopilin PulG
MKQRKPNPSPSRLKHQDGFLLLGVLVMLILILLALSIAAPKIAESIRRDKEIETVHRGMQYARAIQVYYNKYGRYPTTIDQLVKTDNQRFLRKRYLNPMTGKDDWRIIHYGEQRVPTLGLFGQAVQQQTGLTPGVNNGGVAGNGAGSSSPFGSSGVGGAGFGSNNSPANSSPSGSSSGGFPAFGTTPQTLTFTGDSTTDTANNGSSTPTTGGNTGSGIGSSSGIGSGSGIGSTDASTNSGASSGFGSSSSFGGTATTGAIGSTPIGGTQTTGGSNSAFGTPGVSVGAPIIGVGLLSKKTSIKIYKKQTHYNQWEFIYDPNQNVVAATGGVGGGSNSTINGGSASSFGSGSGNGFGSSNGPGFGSSNGPGFGSSNGPGSGSNNGPGFGSSSGPGFGSNNGSTFGSSPSSPTSPTNNSPQ